MSDSCPTNKSSSDEVFPFLQISPELSVVELSRMLLSIHIESIWDWTLLVQDLLTFPVELEFLGTQKSFSEPLSILDISWGRGAPIASHIKDFPQHQLTEVGLSLNYLFKGNAKAKQILRDIKAALPPGAKFDWIGMHLVAQHVRHHGVLIEGLSPLLKDRGKIMVMDTRDEMLDFYPSSPHLRNMYQELAELQKASGGLRAAGERVQKRASTVGYRLIDSSKLPFQVKDSESKLNFFRLFSLHIEVITKSFPGKFDRERLLVEVREWYKNPKGWAQSGLHFVVIEKKVIRGKKRILQK